jgi:hypothetical protein
MYRRLLALGAAVMVGILTGAQAVDASDVAPAPAHGAPDRTDLGQVPAGFASWSELTAVQNDLDTAVTQLNQAPGAATGLGGMVAAPESRRLVLHWKGSVPPATAQVIERLRRTVPIEVRPARHSAAELVEASRAFAARPGVLSAGPNADGSGIVATATAAALNRVPRSTTVGGASVPVSVTRGAPATPAACQGGRLSDCSPHSAGARYVQPNGGQCTTAFKVARQQKLYLITAAHCADDNQILKNGDQSEVIGHGEADNAGRDILLIRAVGNLSNHVYVGNANTGTFNRVTSSAASAVGQLVCTSGSFTGLNCNIQVVAINQFVNFTGLGVIGPLVTATHTSGGVAVGRGDSGGPVITPANIIGNTTAKGTITGLANAGIRSCPPPPNSSSLCSSTVYYADIAESMRFYGAGVVIN